MLTNFIFICFTHIIAVANKIVDIRCTFHIKSRRYFAAVKVSFAAS